MLTLSIVLVLIALLLAVVSAGGKVPLWTSVFVLCVVELLERVPR